MNLPDHQLRVIEERAALDSKLGALSDFIVASPVFQTLPVDEKRRLSLQREAMDRLSRILSERIDNFYRDQFKAETTIIDLVQHADGTFCNATAEVAYAKWKTANVAGWGAPTPVVS
jgi:hypothetical protein